MYKEETEEIGSAEMVLLVLSTRMSNHSFTLRYKPGCRHPDPSGQDGGVVLAQDGMDK